MEKAASKERTKTKTHQGMFIPSSGNRDFLLTDKAKTLTDDTQESWHLKEMPPGQLIGIWEYNLATQELSWSEEVYKIHGVPLDEKLSIDDALAFIKRPHQFTIESCIEQALMNGRPFSELIEITNRAGKSFHVQLGAKPTGTENKTERLVGYYLDHSAIKSVHNSLQETTSQLKEAMDELGSFAYSVSHDIQTPLRAITGFTKILKEDYATLLDEDGQHTIEVILRNAMRFEKQMAAILTISRMRRQFLSKEKLSIKSLVDITLNQVTLSQSPDRHDITVEDLPAAYGDRNMIIKALTCVIDNAIKFSRNQENPKILIGTHEITKTHCKFFIKDNGVGFDSSYKDRLFQAFQRLHRQDEFEGLGIGLAIASIIVTRNGGSIEISSELDKGTTVIIELPLVKS